MTHNSKSGIQPFIKIDILEKLPEEALLKSYNEEFYGSLKKEKNLTAPLGDDNKLFYNFEQNLNASVSSTTGQLLTSYEEIKISNIDIHKQLSYRKIEVDKIAVELDTIESEFYSKYRPEILKMKKMVQSFLADQKTENFKYVKEIAILEKDKIDIQNAIYSCLAKLHKLEAGVGIKAKAYTYAFDQSMKDSEINNKVFIDKEDI